MTGVGGGTKRRGKTRVPLDEGDTQNTSEPRQARRNKPSSVRQENNDGVNDRLVANTLGATVESHIIPTLMQLLGSKQDGTDGIGLLNDSNKRASTREHLRSNPLGKETQANSAAGKSNHLNIRQRVQAGAETNSDDSELSSAALRLAIKQTQSRNLQKNAENLHKLIPDAGEFAATVLDKNENLALQCVFKLRSQGVSDEQILTQLLAPTAIALGVRWEEDLNDFADVTIGVCRLHRILRWLHPQHDRNLVRTAHGGRIALAPVPGEQHSFGLLLVGDMLFRNGWYTDVDIDADAWQLPATVANNWYELIGLSLSCETRIDLARSTIEELRRASCNPSVAILIGGKLLSERPELVDIVGADGTAADAETMVSLAAQYAPSEANLLS